MFELCVSVRPGAVNRSTRGVMGSNVVCLICGIRSSMPKREVVVKLIELKASGTG